MALPATVSNYETQTQAIAKTLLDKTRDRRWFAQMRDQVRWDDKMLGFAMANPGLRVQLFQLVDCLPALHTKAEIARHLQDYLGRDRVELPSALKGLLNFSQPDSMPAQIAASTLSTAVETLAKKYIAGETVEQVLKTLEQLRKQRFTFTLDLLGEAVVTEVEAEAYLGRYLELMETLSSKGQQWSAIDGVDRVDGVDLPKAQVSVKLTAFYSQFDPLDPAGTKNRVSDRIRTLLRQSQKFGVAVHFDMEQYVYKTLTLDILKSVLTEPEFKDSSDVGVTLQAYLRDSYDDL
ncbi:MAG: proline dehydrogenase family protein, partial [Cyanobacteria bacterium P01_A01_bin.114]